MDLRGKTMLITGASGGIGAATAQAAARAGAQIILLSRTRSRLEQVASEIAHYGGRAHIYPVDLTDGYTVNQVTTRIKAELGTPDIILNGAGSGTWRFVEETDPDEAVNMMAAPYFAAFFITRAFLPDMLERDSGTIINMTSVASRLVWPGATAYTAARWAMRGFAEALGADLSGTHIRTMLVTFAKVASSCWENNPGSEERLPKAQSMIPILTSERAAAAIIRGIKHNKAEVVAPFMLRLVLTLNCLFPYATRWLMRSTGYSRQTGRLHNSPAELSQGRLP
jgi:short-subunit dehydrogenase